MKITNAGSLKDLKEKVLSRSNGSDIEQIPLPPLPASQQHLAVRLLLASCQGLLVVLEPLLPSHQLC